MAAPDRRKELTADEIRALLLELGARLHERGIQGSVYVVGGAAVALEISARRVTVDIDAAFHPEPTVTQVAAAMAEGTGCRPDGSARR